MLILGARKVWTPWKDAGCKLLLSPLPDDVDQRLAEETTEYVFDDNGQIKDVKRDREAYVQGIARECLHGWEDVAYEHGEPVSFSDAAREEFMRIQPAREFVLGKVRGLELYKQRETDAAKKD